MKFPIHKLITICLFLFGLADAVAQTQNGEIHGLVSDPSGAVVQSAKVTLTGAPGGEKMVATGHDGNYRFASVPAGKYTLTVIAKGFAATSEDIEVQAGKMTLQNFSLQLPIERQQVDVTEDALGVSTSADGNVSAIVLKGKDLDALSDDPDEMQNELSALAGPSAGPNGAQIFIDGFSGGQLPPKSSIREIRINQNPFSAQYDKLGYGRIEILTKPGTDKFHGSVMVMGNNSPFNSLNPFVTEEPAYYTLFTVANAGGALTKKASWFANVFRRDNQSNSIINAQLLDSNANAYNFTQAVANPQTRLDISPRFDFQLTPGNTLTVRYSFNRSTQSNSGVSQSALESQAYDVSNHENTLQISDTQVLSANMVNETRFQFMRDSDSQVARSSDPTITVQGAFTGGGSNSGTVRDTQNHYELQNYTTWAKGAHSIQFGGRFRFTQDSNYSTSGFNGNYTYCALNAESSAGNQTSCSNLYSDKKPSQYEITVGNPKANVNVFDAGIFYQDDYKFRPNLTMSYGLRYEMQTRISDHDNWAPRLALAWAPHRGNGQGKTVIRAGYGWFFDRFSSTYILNALRENGVNQKQYVVKNPDFYQNAPDASTLAALATAAPTVYQVSPNLKTSMSMQTAIGVERQIGKIATVSATYINSRGIHQYLTDNINAFEPGTYDAATGTGTRPNGINENIYQFQSGGIYHQNQLVVNYTVRAKKLSLFGFYMLGDAKADTSGATYFPSNQFNPKADYGRASFDIRQRFLLGGNLQAPYGVSISPMLVTNSGAPFDITVGQDLNGDNQFNDRPAFATASTIDSVSTKYGAFDVNPAWNAQRIPYNYGIGPSQFSMNLRLNKTFGIGPRVEGARSSGPFGPGGGPPPGGGPGGGGPPGGGLGPGGLSGRNGPPNLEQLAPRRYSLSFGVMARNVFNNVNLAQPVGVLSSKDRFGTSTALAGGFFSSQAANRSVDLQMSFNF